MKTATYRLELLPLIAGSAWAITLSALLFYWLAEGRPRYPYQSNPLVAFISNIGAAHLKELFVTGSIITGLSFGGTITAVHIVVHAPGGRSDASIKDRLLSVYGILSCIAVASAWAAGISLALLSGFDTKQYHERHSTLLGVCFFTLALSAVCTLGVYWGYIRRGTKPDRLRRCCRASSLIVVTEAVLGIAMMWLQATAHYRSAGILEWLLSYVGVFYIWTFIGFLEPMREKMKNSTEHTPLLQSVERV